MKIVSSHVEYPSGSVVETVEWLAIRSRMYHRRLVKSIRRYSRGWKRIEIKENWQSIKVVHER